MQPRRIPTAWCGLWAAAVAVLFATGCGYSSSSLHPGGVRSVYVEMFQSKEFRRGLEMQLTEALRKELDRRTPYRNAPRNRADSVLSGEIFEVRQSGLGEDFVTGKPREMAATFITRFRWKDMRTGKILAEQDQLIQTVEYVQPVGEDFFHASEAGLNALATRIVDTMETGW
ncbi:MAG: LptE family protein [Phycisphaerae bacterium]|nr:LptE family protein [Phycisphaerae bacterium]